MVRRTVLVAVALAAGCAHRTVHRAVLTEAAPRPVGPYAQAHVVERGHHREIWVAGQLGVDPRTGALAPGDAAAQAEQALRNIEAVLGAAGAGPADVVKVTVFMTDLGAFAALNETYARHFAPPFPARATVQVAALPKGALVEIEAVAER